MNIPPVHPAKTARLQAKEKSSGDGGNRTRATFPPSLDPFSYLLVRILRQWRGRLR